MIENYIIVVEVCLLLYIKFKITDKRNFHKSKQNIFGQKFSDEKLEKLSRNILKPNTKQKIDLTKV